MTCRRASRTAFLAFLAIGFQHAPALGATTVYSNDFEAKPGSVFPQWSSSPIVFASRANPKDAGTLLPPRVTNAESPQGRRRFLGEFGGPKLDPTARTRVQQSVFLKLKDLPPHQSLTLEFDLLLLKSWDGSSPQYGPDRFLVRLPGGPTLLDTTFSNNPKTATDRSFQDHPRPNSPPRTGAVAVKQLGYGFFGDSTYHFTFTVPHDAKTLTLEFASDLFEGKGTDDESWGLDNVRVRIPERTAR